MDWNLQPLSPAQNKGDSSLGSPRLLRPILLLASIHIFSESSMKINMYIRKVKLIV